MTLRIWRVVKLNTISPDVSQGYYYGQNKKAAEAAISIYLFFALVILITVITTAIMPPMISIMGITIKANRVKTGTGWPPELDAHGIS